MKRIFDICRAVQAGNYDSTLALLYLRSGDELIPYRERMIHVTEGYRSVFDKDETAEVSIYSAPGRTELGGNHTDHQQGKVLTGSVDLDALACAAPNGTGEIRIFSEGYGMLTVCVNELSPVLSEQNSTAAIIRGVAAGITNLGFPVEGFDAYVTSDVPGGSGLSSSACFEVLLGQTINLRQQLFSFRGNQVKNNSQDAGMSGYLKATGSIGIHISMLRVIPEKAVNGIEQEVLFFLIIGVFICRSEPCHHAQSSSQIHLFRAQRTIPVKRCPVYIDPVAFAAN